MKIALHLKWLTNDWSVVQLLRIYSKRVFMKTPPLSDYKGTLKKKTTKL